MTLRLLAAVVVASGSLLAAQEGRKIPDDSLLVKLQGCATGRTFIVGPRSEHAPGTLEIEQGRRFRQPRLLAVGRVQRLRPGLLDRGGPRLRRRGSGGPRHRLVELERVVGRPLEHR